jgi:4-hydroxy-2-oxoheptanedioate aldolase
MRDLRDIWDGDGTAIGAWVLLREPLIAESAALAGYDYVTIDLQHGLLTFADLEGMVQAVVAGGSVPLVRTPWHDHWMIGRALDAGAAGVIVPMVNTAEDATRAANACRYAPDGNRSIGPIVVSTREPNYAGTANAKVLCIVMIETKEAVDNIDEILEVPGVDAVYIGPSDLSLSYGLRPSPEQHDPVFVAALTKVHAACVRHGVVPGIHATSAVAYDRHGLGYRMITVGYDLGPMQSAMAADLHVGRGLS